MGKQPLTLEQQQLVKENHNLIYSFARSHGLFLEEYYDILAIGLCVAAMYFDSSKGKFSTIAYRCMENEVAAYIRKMDSLSRKGDRNLLYFDAPIKSGDPSECCTYFDMIEDKKDFEKNSIFCHTFQKLWHILDSRERQICGLKYLGYGEREICQMLGITRSNYICSIKKLRFQLKSLKERKNANG